MSRALVATACVLVLAGCAWSRAKLWSAGLTGESAEVTAVSKRDLYLDATLDVGGEPYRFFFPSSYDCTQIVAQGNSVEYAEIGLLPAVQKGGKRCDPVGVLSLEQWATRHGREMTPEKRETEVDFEVSYRDEEVIFARGEFRFARFVELRERTGGGGGYGDTHALARATPVIAVLPNTPECEAAIAVGHAKSVFSEQGAPYTLVRDAHRCEVLGMVRVYQTRDALTGPQVDP
jgi:hypothetical protein